jgi:hypothetical protein
VESVLDGLRLHAGRSGRVRPALPVPPWAGTFTSAPTCNRRQAYLLRLAEHGSRTAAGKLAGLHLSNSTNSVTHHLPSPPPERAALLLSDK